MQYHNVKEMLKKDDAGEVSLNPIERELAEMVVRYRQTIGRMAEEKRNIIDAFYSSFAAAVNGPCGKDLMARWINRGTK